MNDEDYIPEYDYDFDDCHVDEIDMVAAYDSDDFQRYVPNDDHLIV